MKKFIFGIVLALAATFSFGQIDTRGMTEPQIAALKAQAAQVAAENVKPITPEKALTLASTWGNQAAAAAEGFAKAIGIAARELGVTVNDFLKTDAGKLTAALIIWKVAGATIIHMLYGIVFVTVGLFFMRTMYLRLFTARYEKVTYRHLGGMFTGEKMVRVNKSISNLSNDGEWLVFWLVTIGTIGIITVGGLFFVVN